MNPSDHKITINCFLCGKRTKGYDFMDACPKCRKGMNDFVENETMLAKEEFTRKK